VIGQTEVIVRAHVEDAAAARDLDLRVLGAGDDSFGLIETLRSDFREGVCELLIECPEHGEPSSKVDAMQKSSRALRGMRTALFQLPPFRSMIPTVVSSCSKPDDPQKILLQGVVNNC
jgi:hypothetical protein